MRQVVTFFVLANLISWTIWLPLYGPAFGIEDLPTLPFHHGLGGLGPLIASVLTTRIYCGREGLKKLLRQSLQIKPIIYLFIALLSPFLLAVIATGINSVFSNSTGSLAGLLSCKEFPQFNLLTFFVYNLIFFGYGEEVGWRGFALPRFQSKFNAFTSSILLTVMWALWHWPLFLYRPGYTAMDAAGIFGWIFSLLTGSILLTWLYNASRASILICAVFHSTIDIAFTADVADKSIINYMGFLITVWGILTVLIFRPKNLSVLEREKFTTP